MKRLKRAPGQKIFVEKKDKKSKKDLGETKEGLEKLLASYKESLRTSSTKKARLEDLLSRPSAKGWSSEKIKKMTKRYTEVLDEFNFAVEAVDQIGFRLSQIY